MKACTWNCCEAPGQMFTFAGKVSTMQSVLKHYGLLTIQKAAAIKALVFDVDGVLTDGSIIYDETGRESKHFNVKDGFAIRPLRENGILCGAITGRNSDVVRLRMEELKVDFHYHGVGRKEEKYALIKEQYGLDDREIAYIGDDVIDLPILSQCGLAVTPSDALPYVQDFADLVSRHPGGRGVLREVADLVLAAQGKLESVIAPYIFRNI